MSQSSSLVAGRTKARLTFSGPGITGGSLPDGNYRITALSSKIRSTAGSISLDGNEDGTAGGDFLNGESAADNFFRLFGDSNGDGIMNPFETNRFRSALNSSTDPLCVAQFDFDGNGSVMIPDSEPFRQRIGITRRF